MFDYLNEVNARKEWLAAPAEVEPLPVGVIGDEI